MTGGLDPRVPLCDSGIPWLGEIPAHWEVRQLRFFCQSIQTGSTPSQEFMECSEHSEIIDWFTPGDFSESLELRDSSRKVALEAGRRSEVEVFAPGTVFVVGIGATLGKVGFIRRAASANQQINALVPRPNVYSVLLAWVLSMLNDVMRAMANSATLPILNQQRMGDLRIALPPIDEQRAIADYLDRETARLDGLVAAKERVLGLLAEKRRALITRAVTRGLDPHALLRNFGIRWLGEIPAHWGTSKFSWSVFIAEGQVDPEVEPYLSMLLVAPNHIESGTGKLTSRETAAEQAAISGKYLCQTGDVIYSKIRPALRKATLAPEECLCSADMYPLRARQGLDAEYLLFLLLSEPFSMWAILESDRVAMPKINRDALNDLRLPVPPMSEQQAIVAHIAAETVKLDALRAATERTIALLSERRAALIAAAVTGKLDVQGTGRHIAVVAD